MLPGVPERSGHSVRGAAHWEAPELNTLKVLRLYIHLTSQMTLRLHSSVFQRVWNKLVPLMLNLLLLLFLSYSLRFLCLTARCLTLSLPPFLLYLPSFLRQTKLAAHHTPVGPIAFKALQSPVIASASASSPSLTSFTAVLFRKWGAVRRQGSRR